MALVQTLLKTAVLRAGPKVLGPANFAHLAERFGRIASLDLSTTRSCQLALHGDASVSGRDRILREIFQAYYSDGDANRVVPAADIPWAASFVPYYRGFTSVILYNFFRMNYGIRDPVLYRYSILKGRNALWSRQFLLAADRVALIPDPADLSDQLPAHGSVVIEAFHPRISTPGRNLRYFVLYRDPTIGAIAGTHALALAREGLPRLGQPSLRGFGSAHQPHFFHSAVSHRTPLEVRQPGATNILGKLHSDSGVVADGYMTMEAPSGCPTAIWHDGPTANYVKASDTSRQLGRSYTTFLVPDFRRHAPLILISGSQVGFRPRRATVHVQSEHGKELARKEISIEHDNTTLDLLAEFGGEPITGSVNVVIEFDRDIGEFRSWPATYVHLYYRSPGGWADQVHSHNAYGYWEDPFRAPRTYRCRKFAPFLGDSGLEFIYSVVNLAPGLRPVRDDRLRIRVFTDGGSECVVERKLSATGVTNIKGSELIAGLPIEVPAVAIVQIEHETTNFNASWFALDRATGRFAVDHFSGG
ncbi:MAG TPA: hypothetical protein VGR01_11585 [Burkholderiales bacterium]|jgi:hypothetical protein|nr:hypothetical protein [Burkholderiales bacterium]